MATERVRFEGFLGDALAARLERPAGPPRAYVLFAHCFTCSKDLKAVVRISRALADEGFAVLRFDFTGLGESEGDFADTNFTSNLEDLLAAVEYLRRDHEAPSLLVGHSLGGAAVLAVAGRVEEVRAVATLGAPSDPGHLVGTLLDQAPHLEEREEAEVELAGRRFRIKRQLLEDLKEHRLTDALGKLGKPLLIFHSPVDEVVNIDHARKIYQAARHPKSFVSLDDADHLLLKREEDARFVGGVLAAWASRYVLAGEAEAKEELEHGQVVVRGGSGGFTHQVRASGHALTADEPRDHGGQNLGPSPYEYLLVALGACTGMTLRMYADRKEWPLEGTTVRLEHSKIHAEDCESCETEKGKLDRIDLSISVTGDLSEEQRDRLLEIAGKCPVHRTLTSEVEIRSVLAEDDT